MKYAIIGMIIAVFVITLGIISFYLSTELKTESPNIILIMTDDVSVDLIDFVLENRLMPNLQKYLVDEGITFTNSFVTSPACCPSRATSLTGQYPHNNGVWFNKPIFIDGKLVANGGFESFDDSSTVATWLKKVDYNTGYMGKYLNLYHLNPLYIPPGWDNWQAFSSNISRMYNFEVNNNGVIVKEKMEYKTDYLASKAVEFIEESDRPFFLYISTSAVHRDKRGGGCLAYEDKLWFAPSVHPKYNGTLKHMDIPHSPSFNEKNVDDKPPFIKSQHLIENTDCIDFIFKKNAESLLSIDDLVGEIFHALDRKKEMNNTVVIFTSDNGFGFGENRRIGGGHPYEQPIRVPLFIKIPYLDNNTVNALVTNNDIAPTIVEFAKTKPDIEVDGFSLLPIMKDSSTKLREIFLIEITTEIFSYQAVRSTDMIYVDYSVYFNFTEFYDLENDPYQEENVANCVDENCLKNLKLLDNWLHKLRECGNGTCQLLENKFE